MRVCKELGTVSAHLSCTTDSTMLKPGETEYLTPVLKHFSDTGIQSYGSESKASFMQNKNY